MKTAYMDQIYKDFNVKTETVLRYLHILKENTVSTTADIVEFIKLYENLYTSLSESRKTLAIPSDTQFSFEQQNTVQNSENSSQAKEISNAITTQTPLIEYKFEDLLKNLQYLTQSFQNYREITGKIVEAWDESLQTFNQ